MHEVVSSSLNHYFTSRLEGLLKTLDLDWLGYFSQDATNAPLYLQQQAGNYTRTRSLYVVPVRFADRGLGQLHAASHSLEAFNATKLREQLEAVGGQLATLLVAKDVESAIALDREVERVQKENRHYDWCGVYRVEGSTLYLAAFRGAATPHMIIPRDEGICGAAVRENATLNIPDVTADSRYLSCDSRTKSELVVPIRNSRGEAIAEIDIDSHLPNAFTGVDVDKMEKLASALTAIIQ